MKKPLAYLLVVAALALLASRILPAWDASADSALPDAGHPSGACRIKGNISVDGERIYHVPGQPYYDATRIDPLAGERWFCSEAQARAAGWRKGKGY